MNKSRKNKRVFRLRKKVAEVESALSGYLSGSNIRVIKF